MHVNVNGPKQKSNILKIISNILVTFDTLTHLKTDHH